MQAAILGDGPFGRAVADALAAHGVAVRVAGRPVTGAHDPGFFAGVDLVVDASRGDAVLANVAAALERGVRRFAIATTAWEADRRDVAELLVREERPPSPLPTSVRARWSSRDWWRPPRGRRRDSRATSRTWWSGTGAGRWIDHPARPATSPGASSRPIPRSIERPRPRMAPQSRGRWRWSRSGWARTRVGTWWASTARARRSS
jgi:hypothetical protein